LKIEPFSDIPNTPDQPKSYKRKTSDATSIPSPHVAPLDMSSEPVIEEEQPKKRVRFAPSAKLVQVRYFENTLEQQTYRVIFKFVNDRNPPLKVQWIELKEKLLLNGAMKNFCNGILLLVIIFKSHGLEYSPYFILPDGEESKEKQIQEVREKAVLSVMYFTDQDIPNHPAESDNLLMVDQTTPKTIPFDDLEAPMPLTSLHKLATFLGIQSSLDQNNVQPCIYWMSGTCRYGIACRNVHLPK
jgi:hypothetical protein